MIIYPSYSALPCPLCQVLPRSAHIVTRPSPLCPALSCPLCSTLSFLALPCPALHYPALPFLFCPALPHTALLTLPCFPRHFCSITHFTCGTSLHELLQFVRKSVKNSIKIFHYIHINRVASL